MCETGDCLERSCGAVVMTKTPAGRRYGMVQSPEGFWGFPKGHMEAGESETQTALREIEEETGLKVTLLEGFRCEIRYPLLREGHPDVTKSVVFFAAFYEGQTPRMQETEVACLRLMSFQEALSALDYADLRETLEATETWMNRRA